MGIINGTIYYPKAEDEPKGYVHFSNAKSVAPEHGKVAPGRVKVYMNIRLKCLSVLDAETNRLFCHAHNVRLTKAKFRVQQAGRMRVLRDKRKNVHAYIVGWWEGLDLQTCPLMKAWPRWKAAYYDPYEYKHFTTYNKRTSLHPTPVHKADEVLIYDRPTLGKDKNRNQMHGNIWFTNYR